MFDGLESFWFGLPLFYQWLIATLGAIFLSIFLHRVFSKNKQSLSIKQSQKSGDHSNNIQVGSVRNGDERE